MLDCNLEPCTDHSAWAKTRCWTKVVDHHPLDQEGLVHGAVDYAPMLDQGRGPRSSGPRRRSPGADVRTMVLWTRTAWSAGLGPTSSGHGVRGTRSVGPVAYADWRGSDQGGIALPPVVDQPWRHGWRGDRVAVPQPAQIGLGLSARKQSPQRCARAEQPAPTAALRMPKGYDQGGCNSAPTGWSVVDACRAPPGQSPGRVRGLRRAPSS